MYYKEEIPEKKNALIKIKKGHSRMVHLANITWKVQSQDTKVTLDPSPAVCGAHTLYDHTIVLHIQPQNYF